jgi:two-component system, sensor histidine kinase YesM
LKSSSYRSVKTRLILQFSYMIFFFILMNLSVLFALQSYNRNIFQLFDRLNNTVSISFQLGEAHQHLADFFNNYQDPQYEVLFIESLDEITEFLTEIDPQIRQTARNFNEINYYYDFLDIQTLILIYIDKSKVLLARARSGIKRAVLYDHLYELKDYRTRINEKNSNLLFRQTSLIRTTVEIIGHRLIIITISVLSGTLIAAALMIFLAIRMSEKITSPLHNLVLSAENAASGDFSPQKADVHADTEIQILIDAFNNMMDNTASLIKELEEKAELERLLNKAELEALTAQINPHFLFNTLNAINSLAMIEEAEQTGQMIESLSDILRYYLQAGQKEISLREELHLIEQYLKIQKTRFGKRLNTEMNICGDIERFRIPPMLLQPIIENAVKHGLEPKEGPGSLEISANVEKEKLLIKIIDDGIGIPVEMLEELKKDSLKEKEHIGVRNVKRRMEMFYGSGSFRLKSKPGETVFTFIFPLNTDGIEEGSVPGSS